MSETSEEEDQVVTVAERLTLGTVFRSLSRILAISPYPRIGNYMGNNLVEIPHFFGKPPTQETLSSTPQASYGERVIVTTTTTELTKVKKH